MVSGWMNDFQLCKHDVVETPAGIVGRGNEEKEKNMLLCKFTEMKDFAAHAMNFMLIVFCVQLLYSMCMIAYFYYLKSKGIITRSWKITFSAFDYDLARMNYSPTERERLLYGRKLYAISIYSFLIIFPLLILLLLWNDRMGNI